MANVLVYGNIDCPEGRPSALGHPGVCPLLRGQMSGTRDGKLSPSPSSQTEPLRTPRDSPLLTHLSAHQVDSIPGFHGRQVAQVCLGGGDRCCFPEQKLVLDGDFSGFDSRPLPINKHACHSPLGLACHSPLGLALPFAAPPLALVKRVSISFFLLGVTFLGHRDKCFDSSRHTFTVPPATLRTCLTLDRQPVLCGPLRGSYQPPSS